MHKKNLKLKNEPSFKINLIRSPFFSNLCKNRIFSLNKIKQQNDNLNETPQKNNYVFIKIYNCAKKNIKENLNF